MQILPTPVEGLLLLLEERRPDERGFFVRTWDASDLLAHGQTGAVRQSSRAYNDRAGTLRGLHYQAGSSVEAKTVRCERGAIHDVVVDLRPNSRTWLKTAAFRLEEGDGKSLFIPEGLAHGYLTLVDATEVSYLISTEYDARAARGIRWDDPQLRIEWPRDIRCISDRDAGLPTVAEIDLDELR